MKHVCLMFCFIIFLSGCGKNNPSPEIKIKRNDFSGSSENSEGKDVPENLQPDKNSLIQTISSKEVRQHIGDSLTIKGYVADVYLGDKVAYLNFENKFPKNLFSCAIFSGKFDEFGDLSKYKGKNLSVTGKISTYKGKPQVILNSKDQIKIIQ